MNSICFIEPLQRSLFLAKDMACQSEVQIPHGLFEAARKELAELKASHDSLNGSPCQGPLLPKYLPSQVIVPAPVPTAEQEDVHYPCLLTSGSVARGGRLFDMKQLKVKNTFIDGTESDDEDRPPMLKRKTMPYPPRSFETEVAEQIDEGLLVRTPKEPSPASADATMTIIEPFEARQPGFSKGSELHGSGNCKPCAWFWRPQGCANGMDCQHCHQCTAAELRARKKAKKLTKRDIARYTSPVERDIASSAQKSAKQGQHQEEANQQMPEQFLIAHPLPVLMPVVLSN